MICPLGLQPFGCPWVERPAFLCSGAGVTKALLFRGKPRFSPRLVASGTQRVSPRGAPKKRARAGDMATSPEKRERARLAIATCLPATASSLSSPCPHAPSKTAPDTRCPACRQAHHKETPRRNCLVGSPFVLFLGGLPSTPDRQGEAPVLTRLVGAYLLGAQGTHSTRLFPPPRAGPPE